MTTPIAMSTPAASPQPSPTGKKTDPKSLSSDSAFSGEMAALLQGQNQAGTPLPPAMEYSGGGEKGQGQPGQGQGQGAGQSETLSQIVGQQAGQAALMNYGPQATSAASSMSAASASGQGRVTPIESGLLADNMPGSQMPALQKQAISAGVGSSMAAGQPWNTAWVMQGEGNPLANPVKPLFGDDDSQAQAAALQGSPMQALLGAGVSPAQISQLLSQMSGEGGAPMSAMSARGLEASTADAVPGAAKPAALQNQFSGNDFLSALNAARDARAPGMGNAQSGQGQGQSSGQGQNRDFKLLAGEGLGSAGGAKLKRVGQDGKGLDVIGAAPLALQGADRFGADLAKPVEVTGHVTSGAMTRERLSSESLGNIANSIRQIGTNPSGEGVGEMRVRLKPDNLGELTLKVRTQGNDVSLQISASSDAAKKVIEESLGHLRESLATQNLTLSDAKVSATALASFAGSMGEDSSSGRFGNPQHGSQNQSQQQQAAAFEQNTGFQQGSARQQGYAGDATSDDVQVPGFAKRAAGVVGTMRTVGAAPSRPAVANGRLDVRA